MRKNNLLYGILFSMFLSIGVYGQSIDGIKVADHHSFSFYFRINDDLLMRDYRVNLQALDRLDSVLTNDKIISNLDSIVIRALASPDGGTDFNRRLASRRSASIKSYINWKHPHIDRAKIKLYSRVALWSDLIDEIEQDSSFPFKRSAIEAISSGSSPATIEWRLRNLGSGEVFSYLVKHYLWHYISGIAVVYYVGHIETPFTLHDRIEDVVEVIEESREPAGEVDEVAPKPLSQIDNTSREALEPILSAHYTRPFALKTNLLYDAGTMLNIEIEVPISKRFSLAGEWIFPWWLWEKRQHALQVHAGNLEVRYWIKPDMSKQKEQLKQHNPLTGWFIGIYGQGGYYDLEWDKKGYQGEFFSTGLTGGYVLPLSKALMMEFSLAVGYMQTGYRHYFARYSGLDDAWHLIREHNGIHRWVGPTKAKISLMWYPHFKSRKGGNKR